LYFGLLLVKSEFGVTESEKWVVAIFVLPVWPLDPPGRSFLPYSGLYCHGIAHRRLEMLSIRKTGAPNLNLWPASTTRKPEVLSKVPEMVQKVAKLTEIRKTSWSNLKWNCKTGSSCILWPTFDVNTVKLGNGMR